MLLLVEMTIGRRKNAQILTFLFFKPNASHRAIAPTSQETILGRVMVQEIVG
jgi:hypothetical protein